MKISIVMATYNGETFLREQLDSLRTQNRLADEVIIQDDGSTDSTSELVKSYIAEYGLENSWQFIENPVNLGYAENFKRATLRATGDLVCFCDQDDIWHTDKLEKVEKIFQENEGVQVLCSHFTPFVTGETTSELRDVSKEINDGSIEKIEFTQKNMFLDSLGCAMTLRRSFIEKTEKFWYQGFAHDEYAWKLALCLDGLYWYNESLFDRRHHSANVSMRKMRNLPRRIQYLQNFLQSYETMATCLAECNRNEAYNRIVDKQIKAAKLRLEQMEKRKIFNTIPLLFKYQSTYQTKRTIQMELYMSIFRKKFQ